LIVYLKYTNKIMGRKVETFVRIVELENVGSGWVVRQNGDPSRDTHLFTGSGLVLLSTQGEGVSEG
jgi:hypothetical protein